MSQTIVVGGGNCYQIAASYLNDVTLFVYVMNQNGLTNPFIQGKASLQLPDAQGLPTGGTLTVQSSYPSAVSSGS